MPIGGKKSDIKLRDQYALEGPCLKQDGGKAGNSPACLQASLIISQKSNCDFDCRQV